MNPYSGEIHPISSEEEAKRAGLIPIKEEMLSEVQGMNRAQRRAWARTQKRKQKRKSAILASSPGIQRVGASSGGQESRGVG